MEINTITSDLLLNNKILEQPVKNKILIAFDVDNTVLEKDSYNILPVLLSVELQKEISLMEKNTKNWATHLQNFYIFLKSHGITIETIKNLTIQLELNKGFKEIFDLIRENKDVCESIIISGGNTFTIKWLLDHYNLNDIFPRYFANISEPHEELLLKVAQCHDHECQLCDPAQCKRIILADYLKEIKYEDGGYKHVIFIGDGENDLCAGYGMDKNDYLFARKDYPLHNLLVNNGDKSAANDMKCQVISWVDGYSIIEKLKELINKLN